MGENARTTIAPLRAAEAVMGTVVTFDLGRHRVAPGADLAVAITRARALLHRTDGQFSLWKADSPMNALRRGEIELAAAPEEVAEVLELCRTCRRLTKGWFDHEALPGGADPTGLVKGWATQRALRLLVEGGCPDVMVNAGGDIAVAGGPDRGRRWRIGIQHPRLATHLLGVCEIDGAIATSGTYERGAHLYDPFRRRYRAAYLSAAVTGPDLAVADAVATALCVAGREGLAFVEELAGYEALAIGADGELHRTSGCTIDTAA
jgi:FAD:protein FMN transferase